VAIVRRAPVVRKVRVATVRTAAHVLKVMVDLLADVRRGAAAIVRAIAEPRLGVTDQGN
jgi:hypothetical protein